MQVKYSSNPLEDRQSLIKAETSENEVDGPNERPSKEP